MITLRTLGAVGLTGGDGHDYDRLLRQPKRLALLVYLASPQPGSWHRRDTLLGIFWPELDAPKARTALRNALYVVRQEVGGDVVRTRGDEEISIDPLLLQSDAGQLQVEVDAGRLSGALDLYRGDFLPGLFISDAAEFERWLDEERSRLRRAAVTAASRLSVECEARGEIGGAALAQRRQLELEPDDESSARRLMVLLDRSGDRGQALAVFGRFSERLQREFGAEPSAETVKIETEIRSRRAPVASAPAPRTIATARPSGGGDDSVPDATFATGVIAPSSTAPRRRMRAWALGAGVAAMLALTAFLTSRPALPAMPTTLLVMPMENRTGDPANDYIASALAEEVARRLSVLASVRIRSAARSSWPARIRDSLALIGPAFGSMVVLRSTLTVVGDSLQAEAEIANVTDGRVREAGVDRFVVAKMSDAGSKLAASIAGAVFRVPLPEVPRASAKSADPESYRLTMLGWHQLLARSNSEGARELFRRAIDADPGNARAWSGLSSTLSAAATNGLIRFDEAYLLAEAAATRALALDSTQGTAWANLGVMRALKSRSVAVGEPYFQRALAADPANAELLMVYGSMLRFAWAWDRAKDVLRIARQLDPLTPYYVGLEANEAMCADHPEEALTLYRAQVDMDPRDRAGQLGVARTLARLGRWDEAIAQLRALALSRGDTVLAGALQSVHGEEGYWALKHREGEDLLAARVATMRKRWVAPYLLGVAEVGAGHIDQGLDILEAEVRAGSRMVYKLPCNPEIDEVRSMPRFKQLLKNAGALPMAGPPG